MSDANCPRALNLEERAKLCAALEAKDRTALAALPKAELHAHAVLSAPWSELAASSAAREPPPARFRGVDGLFEWLRENVPRPTRPERYHQLVASSLRRMREENVRYVELTCAVDDLRPLRLSARAWAELLDDARRVAGGEMRVALGVGLPRWMGPWRARRLIATLVKTGVFSFVDFCGREDARSLADYRRAGDLARDSGMKLVAHLGEVGSAEDVRAGVEALDLDAVQHGVAVADSPSVMSFLRDRGTVLNVCPQSNVALGLAPSIAAHPIATLVRHGVCVTLNTDDYGIFGADITGQLLALHEAGTLDAEELADVLDNGLRQIPL